LKELAFDNFSGEQVRDGIIAAYAFAAVDARTGLRLIIKAS